jgi:nucleoside-diphosphate-sugar epimerase
VRILVTGATGLIGCHATARLVGEGHSVRAFVRDPAKLERVLAPFRADPSRITAHAGDVTDVAAVRRALRECDALLHCAGAFSHDLADAALLENVNVEGTRVVLGTGADAGLESIVFISSMLALFPPAGDVISPNDPVSAPRAMYAATKAAAERGARMLQARGVPLTIVYPGSCHGPHDPSVGGGPELIANSLRSGRALVTEGGLAYTDVRDLARLLAALFSGARHLPRLCAPSFFVTHARQHALLRSLTGRKIKANRVPGTVLRLMGRLGDLGQRLGRGAQLTREAAEVLTRSVPLDDADARKLLAREPISDEASFRDLLAWMHQAGVLDSEHVGKLAAGDPR